MKFFAFQKSVSEKTLAFFIFRQITSVHARIVFRSTRRPSGSDGLPRITNYFVVANKNIFTQNKHNLLQF